ncbi:SDR family oxidoreductase [Peribacillus psychrosaccharolyticus]|uniref:SDR family oxidoreductase n=1 Tax=Peribacillus psychrosaccharolyticus TaxID=1407 RepID=UPI003D27F480
MKSLQGRIAVVTGASREEGIGSAICLSLAAAGADIFFTHYCAFDQTEGNGAESEWPAILCEKIKQLGVRCDHMDADLSDSLIPTAILDQVQKTLGTPSILINNATYELRADFRSLNVEILDKHYTVNNSGTITLSMEFAKRFEQDYPGQKNGRIIFLVSGGPDPENLAYIATKGLLIAITEPLAVALAPIGITVNALNPGPTDSGWMSEELKKQFLPMFPMGRIGNPKDAANVITFLASDESGWLTGQHLKSDGGFLGK